jgi:hypothetical protein
MPNEQSPAGIITQIHRTPGTGDNFVPPTPPVPQTGLFSQIHQSPSKITEHPALSQQMGEYRDDIPSTSQEASAQTAPGSFQTETRLPSRSEILNAPDPRMNVPQQYDPPGAHFAPQPDKSSGYPEGRHSKHENDDNPHPDSEFLRMFPGARI